MLPVIVGRFQLSQFWIIETLSELRLYAARNDLPRLAEHLESAIQVAHVELANAPDARSAPYSRGSDQEDDG